MNTKTNPTPSSMSSDTKNIITILLLLFFYPVGVIVMWVWKLWPTWVRLLVSVPAILIGLVVAFGIVGGTLSSLNPGGMIDKAKNQNSACEAMCKTRASSELESCLAFCKQRSN